jgi:hypothetical protein
MKANLRSLWTLLLLLHGLVHPAVHAPVLLAGPAAGWEAPAGGENSTARSHGARVCVACQNGAAALAAHAPAVSDAARAGESLSLPADPAFLPAFGRVLSSRAPPLA